MLEVDFELIDPEKMSSPNILCISLSSLSIIASMLL